MSKKNVRSFTATNINHMKIAKKIKGGKNSSGERLKSQGPNKTKGNDVMECQGKPEANITGKRKHTRKKQMLKKLLEKNNISSYIQISNEFED